MKLKTAPSEAGSFACSLEIKADQVDVAARTFEGLASTWERDLGDDIIHRGAFKNTLAEWRSSGRMLPLIDQHNYGSVRAAVGKLLDGKETKDGLWTKWEIIPGVDGDEIMNRLKGGFIDSMSIGYKPIKWEMEADESARWGEVRHLKEVELREVSLVLWPMNPGARIDADSIKAACSTIEDPKALRGLASHIGNLLKKAPPEDPADAPKEQETDPPQVTPGAPADSPKAPEEKLYSYDEALAHRLQRLLLDPKTIQLTAHEETAA